MSTDTFIRVLREDLAVRNGFVEFLESGQRSLHAKLARMDDPPEIYRVQGEIRGIDRIIKIVRDMLKAPEVTEQPAKRNGRGT